MNEDTVLELNVKARVPPRIQIDLSPRALLGVVAFALSMAAALLLHAY